jgi:hypothetical protein
LVSDGQKVEGARIIQEIHCLKNFRHTLVHGVVAEIDDSGRIVVDLWRVRGAARLRSRTVYTLTQLMRHYSRTLKVLEDLERLGAAENLA